MTTMDLGTYLDAQQRLLSAGYRITYRQTTRGRFVVSASNSVGALIDAVHHLSITRATVILANRLARGAR
jgi:capsid protein